MNVDTTSQTYQDLLTAIQTIHDQLKNNYGPILKRMSKEQLKELYQRDPIFKECIDMTKNLNRLADKVGVDL